MEEDHAVTIAAIVGLTAVIAVALLLTTPTTEAVPAVHDTPEDESVEPGLLTATDGNIRAYITDDKKLVYYDRLAESTTDTGELTSASYKYVAVGGNFIAFVSPEHYLSYYDMASGTARHTGERFSGSTLSLKGNVITFSSADGSVKKYDIPTNTVVN